MHIMFNKLDSCGTGDETGPKKRVKVIIKKKTCNGAPITGRKLTMHNIQPLKQANFTL